MTMNTESFHSVLKLFHLDSKFCIPCLKFSEIVVIIVFQILANFPVVPKVLVPMVIVLALMN